LELLNLTGAGRRPGARRGVPHRRIAWNGQINSSASGSGIAGFKRLKVNYISGEESVDQIKLRAQRLDVNAESLFILSETDLDAICAFFQNNAS
jgi:hypothetical protein